MAIIYNLNNTDYAYIYNGILYRLDKRKEDKMKSYIINDEELKDLYLDLCNNGIIQCEDLQDKIDILLNKQPIEEIASGELYERQYFEEGVIREPIIFKDKIKYARNGQLKEADMHSERGLIPKEILHSEEYTELIYRKVEYLSELFSKYKGKSIKIYIQGVK